MKDWRNILIICLVIILIYFIFSGRGNAIDEVRLDALENEKKAIIEKLVTLKHKTETDSLNFTEHLRQDSIISLNTERLETSLAKSRQDYKEAVERNKVVFSYDQKQLDSAFLKLYPKKDL
jgi:Cft2 family RNA processing exonuclease